MKFLIELLLGKVAKSLDGKKTMIGAIGMILVGVCGLIGHYWPDTGIPGMDIEKALNSIAMGVAALWIGHKVEKTKAIIQK